MQENKPVLIVGLGNPGNEYMRTRHNVGFMAIDSLSGTNSVWRNEYNAMTSRGVLAGHNVIFVKPQTYMNNSGDAVGAIMRFYKIPLENLIVIHDDMDLKTGGIKTKIGGGSAGHNGIKSIDAAVGADYRRIRIGISHPRDVNSPISPSDWVLGCFSDDEIVLIESAIDNISLEKYL